jgi:hypothetical protein
MKEADAPELDAELELEAELDLDPEFDAELDAKMDPDADTDADPAPAPAADSESATVVVTVVIFISSLSFAVILFKLLRASRSLFLNLVSLLQGGHLFMHSERVLAKQGETATIVFYIHHIYLPGE